MEVLSSKLRSNFLVIQSDYKKEEMKINLYTLRARNELEIENLLREYEGHVVHLLILARLA